MYHYLLENVIFFSSVNNAVDPRFSTINSEHQNKDIFSAVPKLHFQCLVKIKPVYNRPVGGLDFEVPLGVYNFQNQNKFDCTFVVVIWMIILALFSIR